MRKTEAPAAACRAALSLRGVRLGGLLAGMIATPVAAADLPVKAPAMATPVASWTQFYVGAGFGFDLATGRSSVAPIGGGPGLTFDGLQGADLGLSAFIGADLQVSQNIVLGVFADYDWSHQRTTLSADWLDAAAVFSGTTPSLDQGWTIGGRAGFLVAPDILLYGLAGYSEMKLNNWSASVIPQGGPALLVLQQPAQTSHGYTIGAGIEYRLVNNVSLRGEYRYVGLGSATTVDPINNAVWTNDLSQHLIRISAAYRFGNFETVAPVSASTRMAAPSWTGFYIGAGIGGDAIAPHVSGTIGGAVDFNGAGLGGADVGGTIMVGYDRQIAPQWVIGAFGLVDAATNGGVKFTATAAGAGGISSDLAAVNWSWTAGGRVGYLVAPNTLVYALGGYTGLTLHSVSYDLFGVTGTGPTPQYHGVTFGGGFERYFTNTISARAEYRGTHLETLTNLAAPGWTNLSAGGTVHTLRAILSYRMPTT
jgi:outer membrane immunogenic protein